MLVDDVAPLALNAFAKMSRSNKRSNQSSLHNCSTIQLREQFQESVTRTPIVAAIATFAGSDER